MNEVTVQDMMLAREQRAQHQKQLLEKGSCCLSFTMNIAGPIKRSHWIDKSFEEGLTWIKNQLTAQHMVIKDCIITQSKTGCEALLLMDADPIQVKKMMIELEDQSEFTRLFDLDVLHSQGESLSRTSLNHPQRRCLLCNLPAHECARNRTHTIAELSTKTQQIMCNYFEEKWIQTLAVSAVEALLMEVSITPKPGLIDQNDSGSHKDMDYFTFIASASALTYSFADFVKTGIRCAAKNPKDRLAALRCVGREAEAVMLKATKGVNTHKGSIFTLGLLLGALGSVFNHHDSIPLRKIQAEIQAMIQSEEEQRTPPLTHGQQCFERYHVKGVMEEARQGYPHLFELALPLFQQLRKTMSINEAGAITLLHLISQVEDTNMIYRSDYSTMIRYQRELSQFLKKKNSTEMLLQKARMLNDEFIHHQISPGGCADLLASTLFLDLILTKMPDQIKTS